jgi:hypothetical protein
MNFLHFFRIALQIQVSKQAHPNAGTTCRGTAIATKDFTYIFAKVHLEIAIGKFNAGHHKTAIASLSFSGTI